MRAVNLVGKLGAKIFLVGFLIFSLPSRFSRPLLTLAAAATIIIMIVGIFGNLLTIVALIRCPKVRNVAADFIIRLIFILNECDKCC